MARASWLLLLLATSCTPGKQVDLVIRNGTIYDGSGNKPVVGDLAIAGDRILAIGDVGKVKAKREIDASGLAVSPGFVNMLSWAVESLVVDGRAQSDMRQGVTLEVFGEGGSMGPLTEEMKEELRRRQGDLRYDITWTTLREYLDHLVERGVSPNVASFVGAGTIRRYVVGHANRPATGDELARMQGLVRQAMEEGALGLGSALIYDPGSYATTDELTALAREVAARDGLYISHIRSESNNALEAVDELIRIARQAGVRSEIYHLKAAGQQNWAKLDAMIGQVEKARSEGLAITADMYTYTAGMTGLDAAMPPWVQEGGHEKWVERLRDPQARARVEEEMTNSAAEWENLYAMAGPDKILVTGFKSDKLKPLAGKRLSEVAAMRGRSPEQTAMDLVIEDNSRVSCVYFLMSEENVKKKITLPWMSFGSDAEAPAAEGVFLKWHPHPRAYGTFARLLGRYVRDEGVITLQEAVRRLTSLPATNLKLSKRGRLEPGYFADIVIFDAAQVQDHATFATPHRYATGVLHVFVNGTQVLADGEHTGATPGRVVLGPGGRSSSPSAAKPKAF